MGTKGSNEGCSVPSAVDTEAGGQPKDEAHMTDAEREDRLGAKSVDQPTVNKMADKPEKKK